jgi:hypothetical protein
MISNHHQLKSVWFEEEEYNSEPAGDSELESFAAQVAQAQPRVAMRFSKRLHELSEALVYFFEFGLGAIFAQPLQLAPSSTSKALGGSVPAGGFFTFGSPGDVLYRSLEFWFCQPVFDERVIFTVHFHRAQGDDLPTAGVHDSNVFPREHSRENSA